MINSSDSTPEQLLPLSIPVFQILISLTERDLHGYGIIGDIRRRTGDELVLSTSTLYGAIKRMMRDQLIEESAMRPAPELDDQRRRYYRVTPFGREVADREARRIERLADAIRGKQFQTRGP